LLKGTRYYWRIDERNGAGVTTGTVWSFTATGTLTTLLSDSFTSGSTTNWAPSVGTWGISSDGGNNVYRQSNTSGDGRSFTSTGTSWVDQIVTARVKPTVFNGTDRLVAILGRRQPGVNSYYYATLRNSNRVEIKKLTNGSGSTLASKTFTVSAGTWYPVALEITGTSTTTLRLYIDGVLQLTATDSTSPYTSGVAGLQTFYTSANFDDVLIAR
jgi:pectate lyase